MIPEALYLRCWVSVHTSSRASFHAHTRHPSFSVTVLESASLPGPGAQDAVCGCALPRPPVPLHVVAECNKHQGYEHSSPWLIRNAFIAVNLEEWGNIRTPLPWKNSISLPVKVAESSSSGCSAMTETFRVQFLSGIFHVTPLELGGLREPTWRWGCSCLLLWHK